MGTISLEQAEGTFNFRVAGVIISRGRVLLHHNEGEPWWALAGGRVEMHERAAAAIKREMLEEIGVSVTVERLLWLVEGFFGFDGRKWHELGFYYLLNLPADSPLHDLTEPFFGSEDFYGDTPLKLVFQWFDLDKLEELTLNPSFLRHALRDLPQTTEHLVIEEELL